MPTSSDSSSPITPAAAELFEAAFGPLFDAVMITNANLDEAALKVVYVNEAFERVTGWTFEAIQEAGPQVLQGADTESAVTDRLRADLDAGRPFAGSTINYRRDGSPFQMEWSVSLFEISESDSYYITVQRDVSEFDGS